MKASSRLVVRKGCEGWPLLCETPLEGGNTSRFVDTSMKRLGFSANAAFTGGCRIFRRGAGHRYRRSALYPSLHPGMRPILPLIVAIAHGER